MGMLNNHLLVIQVSVMGVGGGVGYVGFWFWIGEGGGGEKKRLSWMSRVDKIGRWELPTTVVW